MLDVDEQTLEWTSQRKDIHNRTIEQVMDHVSGGGKTLVAVRPPTSKTYLLLGQVSKVDNAKLARCLCERGAELIYEALIAHLNGFLLSRRRKESSMWRLGHSKVRL